MYRIHRKYLETLTALPNLSGLIYSKFNLLLHLSDKSIFKRKDVWLIVLIIIVYRNPCFYAYCVDPDQTPRFAASDRVFTVCKCPFLGTLSIKGLHWKSILLPADASKSTNS